MTCHFVIKKAPGGRGRSRTELLTVKVYPVFLCSLKDLQRVFVDGLPQGTTVKEPLFSIVISRVKPASPSIHRLPPDPRHRSSGHNPTRPGVVADQGRLPRFSIIQKHGPHRSEVRPILQDQKCQLISNIVRIRLPVPAPQCPPLYCLPIDIEPLGSVRPISNSHLRETTAKLPRCF